MKPLLKGLENNKIEKQTKHIRKSNSLINNFESNLLELTSMLSIKKIDFKQEIQIN